MYFAKFLNEFIKPRNLNFLQKEIIYLGSPDHLLQIDLDFPINSLSDDEVTELLEIALVFSLNQIRSLNSGN